VRAEIARRTGEVREDGATFRVVRVETHAVSIGSKTIRWNRLAQHRGQVSGARGGNHRGSIFRLLIGEAVLASGRYASKDFSSWGKGSSASRAVRDAEQTLETVVSAYIGRMPFLWVAVDDNPSRESDRQTIERNAIALLSNRNREPIDPPSTGWLGLLSPRTAVRESGLWNIRHVEDRANPGFLDLLGKCASGMTRAEVR
jgi:hypothetical protein